VETIVAKEIKGAPGKGARMAGRIKSLRKALGLSQVEFSQQLDVTQSTVSKWERGDDEPREPQTLLKLAAMAQQPLNQFLGLPPAPGAMSPTTKMVRVVGELQAGAWREAIEWDHEDQYDIPMPPLPGLPNVPLKAFRVAGTSMNKVYPERSIVFVAPLHGTGLKPKSGNRVLVSRRNSDGLYEATVKEYVVEKDGTRWLWPRSFDPDHQAPVPYKQRSEEVTITGIVMAVSILEYAA
jgi:repressor LexA